jgi:hypothetical protein
MMGYLETLDKLGCELKDDLTTDAILQSLLASYEPFITNFHMNGMEKTVAGLHGILKIAEDSIKKNPNHVMIVHKDKKKRKRWMPPKGKDKEKVPDEPSSSKPKTKGKFGPSPNEECFHFHKMGHWFRNCKKYLKEQEKKKGSETSASGINVIEINIVVSSSNSWIFDTGSPLPSRLVLELNNCYCIPTLCKNIISSSYLEEIDGYEIIIKNKHCSIYYNGIFYAHCPLVNELYVLDLEDKSVYNINTKRARLIDLNLTFI